MTPEQFAAAEKVLMDRLVRAVQDGVERVRTSKRVTYAQGLAEGRVEGLASALAWLAADLPGGSYTGWKTWAGKAERKAFPLRYFDSEGEVRTVADEGTDEQRGEDPGTTKGMRLRGEEPFETMGG